MRLNKNVERSVESDYYYKIAQYVEKQKEKHTLQC